VRCADAAWWVWELPRPVLCILICVRDAEKEITRKGVASERIFSSSLFSSLARFAGVYSEWTSAALIYLLAIYLELFNNNVLQYNAVRFETPIFLLCYAQRIDCFNSQRGSKIAKYSERIQFKVSSKEIYYTYSKIWFLDMNERKFMQKFVT